MFHYSPLQGDVLLELRGRRTDPADQQVLRAEGGQQGPVHRQDRSRQVPQGKNYLAKTLLIGLIQSFLSKGPPRVEADLPDQAGGHRRGRHRQPGDDVPVRLREAGKPGE